MFEVAGLFYEIPVPFVPLVIVNAFVTSLIS